MQYMKTAVTTRHPTLTNRPVKVAPLQGWAIFLGDDKTIHMENEKDEVIEFNIEFNIEFSIELNIDVPTAKGAIYACRFASSTEVSTASTDAGLKVNITRAHCLSGHTNEGSVHKITRDLGWVLTCGSMHKCKHCAKYKAK